jgi:serpin B
MQAKAFRVWAAIAPLLAAGLCPADAVAGADVKALTAAYNASGQALFQELAREPGNVVLSPYSIGAAMAMVRAGARGETERQMTTVLKHTLAREAADAASAALITILDGYGMSDKAPARLSTANALMLAKRGELIGQGYRALVNAKYAAAIHEGASLDDINGWVKERTEGKIDRILDKLPDDAAAVLLNAVYLKAEWASPFSKGATRDDDFKLTAKATVRVPTMHHQANFRAAEGTGYRAIRLDYTAGSLGMIVVLPNEVDGLDAVAGTLDAGALKALLTTLSSGERSLVALALPRFKAAYKTSLAKVLQQAGMSLAFEDKADFSGMTGKSADQPGVKIGDVLHRATLEVAEEGTEASAATAVIMLEARATLPKKGAPSPIPFVVDRPFLIYVVDDASGAILFQGRIADPRA